jgi:hypothetical protein
MAPRRSPGHFADVRELAWGAALYMGAALITGSVAVANRADVDTDRSSKQFLKRIERTGYGEFLFYDWMKIRSSSCRKDLDPIMARTSGAAPPAALPGLDFGFRVVSRRRSATSSARTRSTRGSRRRAPADQIARLRAPLDARDELTVDLERLEVHPGESACRSTWTYHPGDARPRPRRHRANTAARGGIDAFETYRALRHPRSAGVAPLLLAHDPNRVELGRSGRKA